MHSGASYLACVRDEKGNVPLASGMVLDHLSIVCVGLFVGLQVSMPQSLWRLTTMTYTRTLYSSTLRRLHPCLRKGPLLTIGQEVSCGGNC
jgi:hypothetical protein